MELHNTIEDVVIPKVEEIYSGIEKEGNPDKICTCHHCRTDTACYVLNRIAPYYVVSNRGAARIHVESLERLQLATDINVLIHEGIKRISHNQRPNFEHDSSTAVEDAYKDKPVFIIPTITGRVLDGVNFAPISGVFMELLFNGARVVMKDSNWQNPLNLVSHTEGAFSFWPVPVLAQNTGEQAAFEYILRIEGEGYEPINHVFKIPVVSDMITTHSFSLTRTYKLPDLYMFPVGNAEQDLYLDAE